MLTKNDLDQLRKLIREEIEVERKQTKKLIQNELKIEREQIRKLIREEIEIESQRIREELRTEIKLTKMELSNKISAIEDQLKSIEITITKMQKDIGGIISYFDRETIKLNKRITTIEERLMSSRIN